MEKEHIEAEEWRKSIGEQRNGERAKRSRGMENEQREARNGERAKISRGMEEEQREA